MILSPFNRNRTFALGKSLDRSAQRSKRWTRLAGVFFAASLMTVGGFATGDIAAYQDDLPCFAVHPNLRSIYLIEGKESAPDIADPCGLPTFVVHPNTRSIQLIEELQTPNAIADEDSLPAFVVHPNTRSIQLLEGKEAPIELAQPES